MGYKNQYARWGTIVPRKSAYAWAKPPLQGGATPLGNLENVTWWWCLGTMVIMWEVAQITMLCTVCTSTEVKITGLSSTFARPCFCSKESERVQMLSNRLQCTQKVHQLKVPSPQISTRRKKCKTKLIGKTCVLFFVYNLCSWNAASSGSNGSSFAESTFAHFCLSRLPTWSLQTRISLLNIS